MIDVVLANSPAFLADIVQGDVLTAINGQKIINTRDAVRLIADLELSGQTVILSLIKGGENKDITFEFSGWIVPMKALNKDTTKRRKALLENTD